MNGCENIYLIVADRHFRSECFSLLAIGSSRVVRGFASAKSFIEEEKDLDGGCVVIRQDNARPYLNQTLSAIINRVDLVPVVIAGSLAPDESVALMRAGAGDVLPLSATPQEVAIHIENLLPEVARRRQRLAEIQHARKRLECLSPRERDVLTRLARGQSSKEIAREFALSPRTVEVHRANIMRRADTGSLAELLRLQFLTELSVEQGVTV